MLDSYPLCVYHRIVINVPVTNTTMKPIKILHVCPWCVGSFLNKHRCNKARKSLTVCAGRLNIAEL